MQLWVQNMPLPQMKLLTMHFVSPKHYSLWSNITAALHSRHWISQNVFALALFCDCKHFSGKTTPTGGANLHKSEPGLQVSGGSALFCVWMYLAPNGSAILHKEVPTALCAWPTAVLLAKPVLPDNLLAKDIFKQT